VIFIFATLCILILSSIVMAISADIASYIVLGRGSSLTELFDPETGISSPRNYLKAILFPLYKYRTELLSGWEIGSVYGVFYWSTLMGVIWLGIFSLSVMVANLSMKLGGVGPWLDRYFHVRTQPFRILAILATIMVSGPCLIYHFLL
jgi:hypothetical protein